MFKINCSSGFTKINSLNVFKNFIAKRESSSDKPNVRVYNWKTKTKVLLKNSRILTWYICGPTVYDSMHIGHACCYVKFDIIRRILENYFQRTVVQVMNITDIDDKIITKANNLNKGPLQIAREYEIEFVQDMHLLNIKQPDILARVTEFIPEIKHFIQNLIEKDLAYSSVDGSIYFDTTKYNKYGKFVQVPDIVPNSIKKSNLDFALWKAAKPGEPFWDSCWGPGRPGWHIECSAIASYYFGSSVDLHSGGIDLLFPHHENEEAQCCAYHDVDNWVEHWIYTGHLHLGDNIKMSKSLKNTVSVKELLKTYTANEFRVLCLLSNYKNDVEYNEKLIEMARKTLNKFQSFLFNCSSHLKNKHNIQTPKTSLLRTLTATEREILDNLADNFDTSKALQSIICLINAYNKYLTKDQHFDCTSLEVMLASNLVSKTLDNLGVNLVKTKIPNNNCNTDLVIDLIVDFRTNLRQLALNSGSSLDKQDVLKLCDLLRNDMSSVNIKIQDSNKCSVWTYSEAIPKELFELTKS